MSKKLGFNISDLLSSPITLSVSPTLSTTSDLTIPSNEYRYDRQIESSSTNESHNHLSNYEQLIRTSSIYRSHDYSLLPIANGTYPWIQTDVLLKDRFSCKLISILTFLWEQSRKTVFFFKSIP